MLSWLGRWLFRRAGVPACIGGRYPAAPVPGLLAVDTANGFVLLYLRPAGAGAARPVGVVLTPSEARGHAREVLRLAFLAENRATGDDGASLCAGRDGGGPC